MSLLTSRQKTFFLRHALTLLPRPYTSSDASRMLLGFFTIAGLDLLSVLDDPKKVTAEDRSGFVDWIYKCQVPTGGFRAFTGTDLGEARCPENEVWDPANVPATFFALVTLLVLGDDLARVRRKDCLAWLPNLQREDGSFGEVLGIGGTVEGGRDMRPCCCAAGVRYILRGPQSRQPDLEGMRDIDTEALVRFIKSSQGYDGGFAGGPGNESHSGLIYTAISALYFLGKLPFNPSRTSPLPDVDGISLERCVVWILDRQTTLLEEEEDEGADGESEDEETASEAGTDRSSDVPVAEMQMLKVDGADDQSVDPPVLELDEQDLQFAGFSGRPNKIADTCYCFWNTGALAMLHREHLVDVTAMRRYLLEKTQHIVGGFGKGVGATPDIMHAHLGLAALSIYNEPEILALDPAFCISVEARNRLENVSWWRDSSKS